MTWLFAVLYLNSQEAYPATVDIMCIDIYDIIYCIYIYIHVWMLILLFMWSFINFLCTAKSRIQLLFPEVSWWLLQASSTSKPAWKVSLPASSDWYRFIWQSIRTDRMDRANKAPHPCRWEEIWRTYPNCCWNTALKTCDFWIFIICFHGFLHCLTTSGVDICVHHSVLQIFVLVILEYSIPQIAITPTHVHFPWEGHQPNSQSQTPKIVGPQSSTSQCLKVIDLQDSPRKRSEISLNFQRSNSRFQFSGQKQPIEHHDANKTSTQPLNQPFLTKTPTPRIIPKKAKPKLCPSNVKLRKPSQLITASLNQTDVLEEAELEPSLVVVRVASMHPER